jgi:hypothetical protein
VADPVALDDAAVNAVASLAVGSCRSRSHGGLADDVDEATHSVADAEMADAWVSLQADVSYCH